jgi:hypothetical protein
MSDTATPMLPPPSMGFGQKLDLPSGGWFVIGSTKLITERQRRPVRVCMTKFSDQAQASMQNSEDGNIPMDALTPADLNLMFEINDLVATALIIKASFIPEGEKCTPELVCDLPGADYDAIVKAISPYVGFVMNGVDFDPTLDRSSPTSPSSE